MRIITLITDFGTQDWFVGTMKGVILGLNPRAQIVDLTHEIAPGDIGGGAFALAAGCRFFPKGTVHVAVVDPGVGSTRKAIAVQTSNYFFVGPDNGVLSFALKNEDVKAVHLLENRRFFLPEISQTFHGRDVFAPVAAHLSRGIAIRKFGPLRKDFICLEGPQCFTASKVGMAGQVAYIDRFGNAITTVPNSNLEPKRNYVVFMNRKRLCAVKGAYSDVPKGKAVAVHGSTGFLEIAVNGSSAAKKLGLVVSATVLVREEQKG